MPGDGSADEGKDGAEIGEAGGEDLECVKSVYFLHAKESEGAHDEEARPSSEYPM